MEIHYFFSDIKGLKQAEVANQLHVSLPTVKSQIQRARKMVAQGFKDCCGFVENDKGVLIGEIQEKKDCKICN
ncbi:sigma factor-like helix-turn-helix DNA-binding protein [Lacinutrix sp. Bg11-31]|uniref:sigma factor-like helix-turn-helix DNA-binding protein n=1 Tax=Lacinutrix sp. Bg11-31 TaxID=2057808 RepID=UPI00351089CF